MYRVSSTENHVQEKWKRKNENSNIFGYEQIKSEENVYKIKI